MVAVISMITALLQDEYKFSAGQCELFLLSWHIVNGTPTEGQQHNSGGMFDEEFHKAQNNGVVIFQRGQLCTTASNTHTRSPAENIVLLWAFVICRLLPLLRHKCKYPCQLAAFLSM